MSNLKHYAYALAIMAFAAPANAAVIVYDNITPTGVTTGGSGVFVGVTGSRNFERAASISFAGDSIFLTEIQLLLDDGGNTVSVWSDSPGEPGALLASAAASTLVVDDLYSASFAGDIELDPGTTYWISVSRPSGSSAWRYTTNGPYQTGNRMNRINGGPWADSSPRFGQLYGLIVSGNSTVIPLPAPILLFLGALASLGALRRRG